MRLKTAAFAFTLAGCGCDREPGPAPQTAEASVAPKPQVELETARSADPIVERVEESREPAQPDPNVRPELFGVIQPPAPLPSAEELIVHGLAGFEVVTVYAKPDLKSTRLGHLRIGQRLMVTAAVEDEGEGCKKGFHALQTGGYACASKGLIVDANKPPYMHMPPPAPRVDTPHPYDYAVVAKDGIAMWWRTADEDERQLAEERYERSLADTKPAGDKKAALYRAKSKARSRAKRPAQPLRELPSLADGPPPSPEQLAELARKREQAAARKAARRKAAAERKAERARKAARLPLHPGNPFMSRGNIVSVGSRTRDKGRTWLRTARGGYIDAGYTYRKKTFDFSGQVLDEGTEFPFGFVMNDNAGGYELTEHGRLRRTQKLPYRSFVDLEPERHELGGRSYYQTTAGLWVRASDVRVAQPQPIPEGLASWERWIDVSLGQQLLVAYEGTSPVFTTLVSTGKKGTQEESFRTPTGKWRIQSKHITSSMAGRTASDGEYSIQDVPWTMFFEGNYALHGAFWHQRFGRTRSHGCVNLGPSDARWLFYWTTPFVPELWHGVKSQESAPGSLVVVRS